MNQKTANKKYNPNSAITHLQRMGKSIQGAACIDNVSLTYSGNKLNTAQDTGISASMMGDAFHFVDGDDYYSEYGYDGCGSLTSDSNKGIHMIVYDFNGMPTCVWFDNGSITDYVYTADGVKLKTIHRTAVPGTVPSGSTPSLSEQNTLYKDSTLYIGALEVNSNIKEKYHFAGGFMEIMVGSLDTYNYYNTDHLGNVRHVSRSPLAGSTSIIQVNNYYPFGGLLKEGEHHWDIQNRFYNGKEYDRMQGLNLYDYSARQYDPAVCQFTSMDPLCEKYYHVSPYAYCAGNPVKYVDPDGRKIIFVNGYLGFGSPQGGATYWNGSNSSFVKGAQYTFKDYAAPYFTNYEYDYLESASVVRESLGYQYAKDHYKDLVKGMKKGVDKFNFVSHSMGGAFSEGMMRYIVEQGWEIENAVFLNAWEPSQITNKEEHNRIDATCTNDPVQFLSKPIFGEADIPSSDEKIRIKSDKSIMYIHRDLIDGNSNNLWNLINDLLTR